ncbi:hypothetical protein ACFL6U_05460 [Planctomycetota bacterium]
MAYDRQIEVKDGFVEALLAGQLTRADLPAEKNWFGELGDTCAEFKCPYVLIDARALEVDLSYFDVVKAGLDLLKLKRSINKLALVLREDQVRPDNAFLSVVGSGVRFFNEYADAQHWLQEAS